MEIQLTKADYEVPDNAAYADQEQQLVYLQAHREGWFAFANNCCTEISASNKPRGEVPGLGAFKQGRSAAEEAGFTTGFRTACKLHFQRVEEAIARQIPAEHPPNEELSDRTEHPGFKPTEVVSCVALYGGRKQAGEVSRVWVAEAIKFLAAHNLPVREFDLESSTRELDRLRPFPADQSVLESFLNDGEVRRVCLYAHSENRSGLGTSWEGHAKIDLDEGVAFLGVPVSQDYSSTDLLLAAHELNRLSGVFSYGIAYEHHADRGPGFYALGIGFRSANLSNERADSDAYGRSLGKWSSERVGGRRYLQGWFRDVYPAQLLTEEHLSVALPDGKTIKDAGVGKLTPLDERAWLWEVPDSEIESAKRLLREAGRVVCA